MSDPIATSHTTYAESFHAHKSGILVPSTVGILGSILAMNPIAFNFLANIFTKELCLTCRGPSVLRQRCTMCPNDSLTRQPAAQMVLVTGLYLDSRNLFYKTAALTITYLSHLNRRHSVNSVS